MSFGRCDKIKSIRSCNILCKQCVFVAAYTMTDQHTNIIIRVFYMQPQIHTACTIYRSFATRVSQLKIWRF
jgi:hypothetical protein